jgi:alpha-L-rhamnosidase
MKMKTMRQELLGVFLLTLFAAAAPVAGLRVADLTCEHAGNPLGLATRTPRLSWRLESGERGQGQTAYRILAARSAAALAAQRGDLWDSGKVAAAESVLVPYAGAALKSGERVWWQVQAWDKDGRVSPWSEPACFEVGLLDAADWGDAKWIRLAGDPRTSELAERRLQTKNLKAPVARRAFPAPLLRREFSVRPGVAHARAYVCGLGLHELFVNGQRIGNDVLQPAATTYDERAFAVAYDVTAALAPGRNVVGLALGNGFFGQNMAFLVKFLHWGPPVALAKLVIAYDDGTCETIVSDGAWRAATGPVVFDNLYAGESYDARLEVDDWSRAGFDDKAWQPVEVMPAPTKRVEMQQLQPCRRISEFKPVKTVRTADGRWLVDLGRNIAGWVRLRVTQPAGTRLTLRFAEILSRDSSQLETGSTGHFATGCIQTDIYVCRGGGVETWEPRFTYHGFRYVEVTGCTTEPELTGVVVHTDLESHGSFASASPLLDRIYQVSRWTIEDNVHGLTEDCPHRERCAWLGDAHAQAATTLLNYNAAPLFAKFMDDVETVLGRGGQTYEKKPATPGIPCNIAVGRRLCQEARPDWGVAVVLLPWEIQRYTGDDRVIRAHYPLMARWVDHVSAMAVEDIINQGYGDWCPPGGNENIECPVPLSSTAFHIAALRLTADAARLVGKPEDAARFDAAAKRFHIAFNKRFYDAKTRSYGSQTANVLALRFGLEPEGERLAVGAALAREVTERHQGHPFIGIHGGVGLFTLLGDTGHADVAWRALNVAGYPGYKFVLDLGLTTWPERYDADFDPATARSLNHPMQSGFATWFHEAVGGLRPLAPGFRRFELRPQMMKWLDAAHVEHRSPYGAIVSDYRREGGNVRWSVTVPVGTQALVTLPTDNASAVRESGQPLAQAHGVSAVRLLEKTVCCTLAAGNFIFVMPLNAQ